MKFVSIVFCDEIRKEVTGKDLIIGAYGGDVVVSEFPATIRAAFWLELEHDDKDVGSSNLDFRIALEGVEETLPIKVTAETLRPGSTALSLTGMMLFVEKATQLSLELREDDGWTTLKKKAINLRPGE